MDGGTNLFNYANSNPLLYYDDNGKFANFVIGGVIGFGFDFVTQLIQYGGNWRCIDMGQLAASTVLGMIGGYAGGKGLMKGLSRLSNKRKGEIGEFLSRVENRMKLSREAGPRNAKNIPGQTTKVDSTWRSRKGDLYYVESKFGTANLTKAQRRARDALGDSYRIERWDYSFFNRIGSYGGGVGVVTSNQIITSENCECN